MLESDSAEIDFAQEVKETFSFKHGGWQKKVVSEDKPSWAREVESRGGVKWNPLSDSGTSWDEHSSVLNAEFSAIVSIAAAVGTMWAGGFGAFAAPATTGAATASMATTVSTAMGQAAIVGTASTAAVSAINNNFDLGKVAEEVTSKKALKGLAINMVTAGATAGLTQAMGVGQLKAGMDMMDRAKIIAQQGAISAGVRTAISATSGEKVASILRGEALSGGLALGQSKVGDIAADNGLSSGSVGKIAMHATTGAIYSAATGASPVAGIIGGAVSEIVTGLMESGSGLTGPPSDVPLTAEQAKINAEKRISLNSRITATTKIVSATASLLSGGSAKDINATASIGESAVKHNRRLHPSEERVLAELQVGKTPEEQRRLELAAKAMVRASAGTAASDGEHIPLTVDEIEGSKYVKEQKMLSAHAEKLQVKMKPLKFYEEMKLAEGLSGDPSKYRVRTFDYTVLDAVEDAASSFEESLDRVEKAEEFLAYGVGSVLLKGASGVMDTMPFGYGKEASDFLASGSSYLYDQAAENASIVVGSNYKPREGARVQQSFKSPVEGSYVSEHPGGLITTATLGVGGLVKAAGSTTKAITKALAFKPSTVASKTVTREVVAEISSESLYAGSQSTRLGINEATRVVEDSAVARVKASPQKLVFERKPDGGLQVKGDPLAGTKKQTLDVRHEEKIEYQALQEAANRTNPNQQTATTKKSKVVDMFSRIARVMKNIGQDM